MLVWQDFAERMELHGTGVATFLLPTVPYGSATGDCYNEFLRKTLL